MEIFNNVEAELNFLTALVKLKDAGKHVRKLAKTDFYLPEHQAIFAAMQALDAAGKPIEVQGIAQTLIAQTGTDNCMAGFVAEMANNCLAPSWGIDNYVDIIRSTAYRRHSYEAVEESLDAFRDGTRSTEEVLDGLRNKLRSMTGGGAQWSTMQDVLFRSFNALERRSKGEERAMSSGLATLDRITGGFHRGELCIIGARPAIGKSAFGMHCALTAVERGFKVAVFSREMSPEQYGNRILAMGTNVDPRHIRSGDVCASEWDQIAGAIDVYGQKEMHFLFDVSTIEGLRTAVQDLKETSGLDLLVCDYLQLVQTQRQYQQDYLRIAAISKALKDLALDLNISILALAQVGRSVDGCMPRLSDLRGAGDMEQDADVVIFLHQPEDENDDYVRPDDRSMFGKLESMGMRYMVLGVAKNRQGETSAAPVLFNPARMQFQDINRGMKRE